VISNGVNSDLMDICDYVLLGCVAHGRVRFFIRSLALRNTSRPTPYGFECV
jgi:hypothetical protein